MFRRVFAVQVLLAAVMALAVCSFSPAANESSTITKTKSIAAFKNGLGFFLREGEAVLKDGWAISEVVPAAALGTYWVGSPKSGVSIERLIATQDEETLTVPAITVQEMLKSNVGKKVKITGSDGKVIEGKIISVPDDRKPDPERPTYPVTTTLLPYSNASLVLIETQTGTAAIEKNRIGQIEFEGTANTDFASKEVVKRFRFKVSGAKDKAPITIGYLQKGVSWSPAYLVELLDDKNARITMQGLLINDVEDIDGAEVYFVVGYPNFMFADTQSPLTLTQSIADFVQGIGGSRSSDSIHSQSVTAYAGRTLDYSAIVQGAAGPAGPSFGYSAGKETPGAQEEDLFLYHMKDVSLKKGERAYYTVFTADVPYEHVYEWNVPDTSNVQSSGYVSNSQQNDQKPVGEQVWHKLKLTNTSKFPWTTAPGMAMSNGQPLAQDTLSYTSKGAKGDLRLTVATDISVKKSESEKSREDKTSEMYGYRYSKVTSDGKLTIKNYKSKPVTVTVKKTLTGEVVSTDAGGKAEKTSEEIKAVNPTSIITWEVPLKAGEEKILDYTYFTYVRY